MIYLDNAATSYYKPPEVAEAVKDAIMRMGNCSRGTYTQAMNAGRMLLETRSMLADLFHAEGPDCIAFTMNSTHALNLAIQGSLEAGDYLLTTVLEHNSVLRPAYIMEEKGVHVQFAGCDQKGRLDLDLFETMLKEMSQKAIQEGRKLAAAVTHASNLTGNLVDLKVISGLCRKYHARLIVDASQTAGIIPIDMQELGIDLLCFTGHKALMGPQGTGGIAVRRGAEPVPLMGGGSGIRTFSRHMPEHMPELLEAGTQNIHGIAGLHAALQHMLQDGKKMLEQEGVSGIPSDRVCMLKGQSVYAEKENKLRILFLRGIERINDCLQKTYGAERVIQVYGAQEDDLHAAIVPLNIGEEDSAYISDLLSEEYEIATRSGGHCAPLMHQYYQTVEQGMVRFSFSHYNTEEQISETLQALQEIAEEYIKERK